MEDDDDSQQMKAWRWNGQCFVEWEHDMKRTGSGEHHVAKTSRSLNTSPVFRARGQKLNAAVDGEEPARRETSTRCRHDRTIGQALTSTGDPRRVDEAGLIINQLALLAIQRRHVHVIDVLGVRNEAIAPCRR